MDVNEHEKLSNIHFDTKSSKGTTLLLLLCITVTVWIT